MFYTLRVKSINREQLIINNFWRLSENIRKEIRTWDKSTMLVSHKNGNSSRYHC